LGALRNPARTRQERFRAGRTDLGAGNTRPNACILPVVIGTTVLSIGLHRLAIRAAAALTSPTRRERARCS